MATLGDVQNLKAAYDRWKVNATKNGGDRTLVLPLKYTKGLSAQFSKAHGRTTLDLIDGAVSLEVSGLSDKDSFDVWMIDNRPGPGHSVRPEPGDAIIRVGTLKHQGNTATLNANSGANVDELLRFARHEIEDAKKVLTGGGGLHPGAIAQPGAARGLFTAAIQNPVGHRKIDFIERANRRLDAARGDIVV